MTTGIQDPGNPMQFEDEQFAHPAFWEVAVGTLKVVTSLDAKYREAGERDGVLTKNIIQSLATCLSVYAVGQLYPAEIDTRGVRLNNLIAACLTAILGPPPVAPELVEGKYPTGWDEAA